MPIADDYRTTLQTRFRNARAQGKSFEIVTAGDLYRESGAKPEDHQMPNCCSVMKQEAKKGGAKILEGPPSGQGPTLKIRYALPR